MLLLFKKLSKKLGKKPSRFAPSDEVKAYMCDAIWFVEATNTERANLWKQYGADHRQVWTSDLGGYGVTVGTIADKPICLSILYAIIGGKKVVFWYPTSVVVDYDQIAAWFDYWFPSTQRIDAERFYLTRQ